MLGVWGGPPQLNDLEDRMLAALTPEQTAVFRLALERALAAVDG